MSPTPIIDIESIKKEGALAPSRAERGRLRRFCLPAFQETDCIN